MLRRRKASLTVLLALLTIVGIALSHPGPTFAASPAIIDNGTVQLGINPAGDLNVPDGTPTLDPILGTTTVVGLRYIPTNYDGLSLGCLCEGWGVANADTGTVTFSGAADESTNPFAPGLIVVDAFVTSTLGKTRAESVGSAYRSIVTAGDGRVRVTHDYHPSTSPKLYQIDVTIENIGATSIGDLRYRRVMDWDVQPFAFHEFVEIHLDLAPNIILGATTDGFRSANPLDTPGPSFGSPATTLFPGSPDYTSPNGPADQGSLFDFGFGALGPGQSITFRLFYGAAATRADALTAIGAVGATSYSLGIPSTAGVGGDPSTDGPNIYIFAVTKAASSMAVTSSVNPSAIGQPVTFTATVSAVPAGSGTPTGTVQFMIDGANFGGAVTLTPGGTATSGAKSDLSVGSHTITAVYNGDANFSGSTSPAFTQTVVAGGIKGQVTRSDNSQAVPNAQISVRTTSGAPVLSTTTDVNGNYNTLRSLAPGKYLVRVFTAGFATTYYIAAQSVATATQVPVFSSVDTIADVTVSPVVGGISGHITSTAASPPYNLSIFDAATGGFIAGFTTDGSGNYNTGQTLAPGKYKVTAQAAGSETTAFGNTSAVATGAPVTVGAGSTTTGTDIALPALGGITGVVTDTAPTPNPLAGVIVDVFDYGTNSFIKSSPATGTNGVYTIGGLGPLQAYRVRVRQPGPGAVFGTVFASNKFSVSAADVITAPAGANTPLDFALAQGGGIKGTVTDAGLGIPGIIVDIFDGVAPYFALSSNNNLYAGVTVTTNDSGNFDTGRVLAPGTYKVRARFNNNVAASVATAYIPSFYGNGLDLSTATAVTVTAGFDTTSVNIALTKGGTITGTIRDRASLQPIAGAGVGTQRVAGNLFVDPFNTTTDANGNYKLAGLPTGEWLVTAQATGHILAWYSGYPDNPATDFSSSTPIQVTGTSTFNNANINLQPGGGAIQGRITRSDNGQPVPVGTNVSIRGPWPRTSAVSAGGAPGVPPFTDVQGNYSFTGLAPGRYALVEAEPNQVANGTAVGFSPFGAVSRYTSVPVTVTDGDVTTADFQALGFTDGATPRRIRGTLKDASTNPVRDAFVLALEPTALTMVRVVWANDDGSFEMNGLAPGRYLIGAQTEKTFVSGVFDGETVTNAGTLVDVTAGDATGDNKVNLVLPNNAGTITGTITRSDTGLPLMGASISVRNFAENSPSGGTSRADGTFLVRGLAPGSYKVRVSAPKFVTKYFRFDVPGGTPLFNDGSFVTVSTGVNTPNINVALDPTGGALTGTVRREDTLQPVVAAVVGIRDAVTGSDVTFIATDANGVYKTEGLGPGSYTVQVFDIAGQRDKFGQILAARFATQWFSGRSTRESSDPVSVASVGTTGGIDFLVSPTQGSISGRAFRSDGTTPLGGVAISIFDQATGGFVRGAGVTDHNGNYAATGLAPGSYVARAAALGFARQFHPGVPSRATATTLTVASDLPDINFNMTLSSDIPGTISYGGAQTGPLRVRLFNDAGLTHQVYETVIASPSFAPGQAFSFAMPAPDTRGILPGTYYLAAFIDSNANGFQDPTEALGQLGAPTALTVAENTTLAVQNFTISDPPPNPNSAPVAQSQLVIVVQGSSNNSIILTGLDAETFTANLTYTVTGGPSHGTLTNTGQQRSYSPNPGFTGTDTFTFTVTDRGDPDNCGAPSPSCAAPLTSAPATVTIQVNANAGTTSTALSNPVIPGPSEGSLIGNVEIDENAKGALFTGSTIKLTLPAGLTFHGTPTLSFKLSNGAVLNAPILESPSVLAFTLAASSTTGPASILVSGISVDVAPGFLGDGVVFAAVLTTISGPNPGVTPAAVQNATVVTPAAGPAITDVSPTRAAQGATGRVVVITGANFASDASVSFGPGVTAVASVDSPSQITVTLTVAPAAALGSRDVIVTNVSAGQSVTKAAAFEITAPPTVTGISGTLPQGADDLWVTISGTGFVSGVDLAVIFSGDGITVKEVGYTGPTSISARVKVEGTATLGARDVTVVNPDGGTATAGGLASVVPPPPDLPTLPAPPSKSTTPPPPAPAITNLTLNAGALGSSIKVNGSGFSATAASNSVAFAGASGTRVTATVTAALTTELTVTVPPQAATGNVTVAVGGVLSNAVTFTVTSPALSGVLPNTGTQGMIVNLTLTGVRFAAGAAVSFSGPLGDIVTASGPIVSPDGTSIQLSVSIALGAQISARNVTVTNPDGASSTLPGAFQVQAPVTAGFEITLPAFLDISTYLPSVGAVSVTRDSSPGKCTAKAVTPTAVQLQAHFTTTANLAPPTSVTFAIAPSAIPGTSTNEDCEIDPLNATKDFSIGTPDLTSQQVVVTDGGGGFYLTTLYSYDWGGKVTVTVTGTTSGVTTVTATGSRTLPIDTDGDDLPDAYEKDAGLNADQNGVNALNFQNPDQNANGVKDRDDRFAKDGLSNFEKYRGVYLAGPSAGRSGPMSGFQRLGAGMRHLFVRGRGFGDDPAITAGFCGINFTTGVAAADSNPCPVFQVGPAYQGIGVLVHNVSASFTALTELPRKSFTNTTAATLDMATVVYDGTACNGGEPCDTTGKFGIRQWQFYTLGFSQFGSATAYGGIIRIFKRPIEAYFNNRPYQHRTNDPARVVTASDGTAMLAPITKVGDSAGTGADNGLVDSGDATVSGQLAGDTYIPGSFTQQLSALDANNDRCVELPTVSDPTILARCTPNAESAASPSATKQQVVRHLVTHELGHGVGVNTHTTDATDIMYQYTINWTRDGNFSGTAASLIQIHNKGLQ